VDTPSLSTLDRRIIHALVVAPRASWRDLADAIGSSDQTIARHYRALSTEHGLRVTVRLRDEVLGLDSWMVRLQCTPDAAIPVAEALAAREDTSWVRLASGGTEVICGVQTNSEGERGVLLLDHLTGSRHIVGISAHLLLHVFSRQVWSKLQDALNPDEVAVLSRDASNEFVETSQGQLALHDDDERLLKFLRSDGRMSAARVAEKTGWHESRVRRRIAQLTSSGALEFDLDIDDGHIGIGTTAQCWVTVEPSALAETGALVATHAEVPYVASYSGTANLLVSLACRDAAHLYTYLTEQLGRITSIRAIETVPLIRTYKRTATTRQR
jgi:DNA-binding Lrp family transcriptional regulator